MRIGWGHSSVSDSVAFAKRSGARRLVAFHHDPTHDDDAINAIIDEGRSHAGGRLDAITAAAERGPVERR